jgi:hypothetical protein
MGVVGVEDGSAQQNVLPAHKFVSTAKHV